MYIHIYIYIYTHIHIHIYIYIHDNVMILPSRMGALFANACVFTRMIRSVSIISHRKN